MPLVGIFPSLSKVIFLSSDGGVGGLLLNQRYRDRYSTEEERSC